MSSKSVDAGYEIGRVIGQSPPLYLVWVYDVELAVKNAHSSFKKAIRETALVGYGLAPAESPGASSVLFIAAQQKEST